MHQLVSAREADPPDLGFMARLMALCSLPRTNPGNRKEYKRANGPYKLIMTATGDTKLPWPELNYTTAPGVLILSPSKPAIAPTIRPLRLGQ